MADLLLKSIIDLTSAVGLTDDTLFPIYQSSTTKKVSYDVFKAAIIAAVSSQVTSGQEVELQATSTELQWRYVGAPTWTTLVALSTLKGLDGKTLAHGAVPPYSGDNELGDFYINTDTYELYGPKTALGWGTPVSLVGPAGKSAYELAVSRGFVGTLDDWLASLHGTSGAAVTVLPNQGIVASGSTLYSRYNTTVNDATPSVTVGGAASQLASAWKALSLVEVLDAILFPTQAASYVPATLTFTGTLTPGQYEVGVSVVQQLHLELTKNDAGVATNVGFKRNGVSIASFSSPSQTTTTDLPNLFGFTNPNNPNKIYSATYTDNYTVLPGVATWAGTATHATGQAKKNSAGVVDAGTPLTGTTTNPQLTNELAGEPISINGIYPYFWGKSGTGITAAQVATAIQAGNAVKVLTNEEGSFGSIYVTYNATGEYIWLAVPANEPIKTKWFFNSFNQGNIGASQFILAPVTQNVTSPSGLWSSVSYRIYISNGPTTTTGELEFLK